MEKLLRLLCLKAYQQIIYEINTNTIGLYSYEIDNNILVCKVYYYDRSIKCVTHNLITIDLLKQRCSLLQGITSSMFLESKYCNFVTIKDIIVFIKSCNE